MTELLEQGLVLSAFGLGLTFSGLAILVVLMLLLERIFRTRKLVPDASATDAPKPASLARDTHDEEIVAAIATALTYVRSLETSQGNIGASLEKGPGRWWSRGLIHKHQSRINFPRGRR